jgi:putative ATP-dependent endonuclease of the OLD family
MQIHRVVIKHFRGIDSLEWDVGGRFVCLIGPGDSGKSTILDAIECALNPRWNVTFDDTDFRSADVKQPIEITVTLGELPDELKSDGKYGLELRGWNLDTGLLHDEPQDGDELVLSIRLRVDETLEPKWVAVNDRNPTGRPIAAHDRELLGLVRIGAMIDQHLGWSRGSVLSRLTEKGADPSDVFTLASRAARQAVSPTELALFAAAAGRAQSAAKNMGVTPVTQYEPRLDVRSVSLGSSALSLHDGLIPLRRAGFGTRRLLALALEREAITNGSIALIDEIEQGLEPHRVRGLLRVLHPNGSGVVQPDNKDVGQIVMTTHSSIVPDELSCDALRIVRSKSGAASVHSVDLSLQKVIRKYPEALLGKKLVVCEGETEVGFCRALDISWQGEAKTSFGELGIVPVDGDGSAAPDNAKKLRKLDYNVVWFGDSDVTTESEIAQAQAAGVQVLLWPGKQCIEQRIINDLPWTGIIALVRCAFELKDEQAVRAAAKSKFKKNTALIDGDLNSWPDDPDLRKALASAAKNNKWFKTLEGGMRLGNVVTTHLPTISATPLALTIGKLRAWADQT